MSERTSNHTVFANSTTAFENQVSNCERLGYFAPRKSSDLVQVLCDTGTGTWNIFMGYFMEGREHADNADACRFCYKEYSVVNGMTLVRLKMKGLDEKLHNVGFTYDEQTSVLTIPHAGSQGPSLAIFYLDLPTLTARYVYSLTHAQIQLPARIYPRDRGSFEPEHGERFTVEKYDETLARNELYFGFPPIGLVRIDAWKDRNPDASFGDVHSGGLAIRSD
ncbi:hypothetical protein GGR57DRAFT_507119 [Xylariaceae sp. FL1272]|nr:hypothetical protein GGR57DRAFT_507119 [Xylariaceae sp. FL1272]